MSDSYIQVQPDSSGKKIQTFQNIIGIDTVESEAVTIVASSGSEIGTITDPIYVALTDEGTATINIGNVVVNSGTLRSVGTVFYQNNLGTLYAVTQPVGVGTVYYQNNLGTLHSINQPVGVGTVFYQNNLGTLYAISQNVNVVPVGAGTFILGGSGTVNIASGQNLGTVALAPSSWISISTGTLSSIPNVVVGSGTLQMLNGGTLNTLNSGTLQTVSNVPNVGTVFYQNNLGTLYAIATNVPVVVQSGTLQMINAGTITQLNNVGTLYSGSLSAVTQLGSANVYSKHDLHTYHTAYSNLTASGTIVNAVASNLIKVHSYRLSTDGTYNVRFMDTHLGGGTLDGNWLFNQREGVISNFAYYPAYHFATRAGSALFMGTIVNSATAGTLNISVVYTDDDLS